MRLVDPIDQATGLRRLFASTPVFRAVGILGPDSRRNARVCADLALGLGRRGKQILVVDEGRAPYNVGGMWGVLPRYTLAHVPGVSLRDAALEARPGIRLLPAPEGVQTLAGLNEQALLEVADHWGDTPPDWMLVNGRNGPGEQAGLATTAELRILVLPGSKDWLAEAYGALKSAHAAWSGGEWLVLVEGADVDTARRLSLSLQDTAQRFLGFAPGYLGCLPVQKDMKGSAEGFHGGVLAEGLLAMQQEQPVSFEQYWQRLWLFSRMAVDRQGGGRTGVPGNVISRGGHGSHHPG
ncbi:MAG: hypothetical protein AB1421_15050 [Pseudomonadota bacterium]